MICLKCHYLIDNLDKPHYGLHGQCFRQWFAVSDSVEFISLQRRSSGGSDLDKRVASQNTSFFHGTFKKYSANLDGHSYILKMRQDEAPELPEVECLCNEIGELLNVPVAEFYLIDFNGDRTFVTKNFIKPGVPTDLQHIYHFRAHDQHSCEGIIQAIAEKTQSRYDVTVFIRVLLFDALIGNHDRHGRNLAFVVTAKGASLSPIYDNVSYLSLEQGPMLKADFNPTGKVSTSLTHEPSMKDYVQELIRLGYRAEVLRFHKSIKLSKLYQLIDDSFCSLLMKDAIKALVSKRFKELENEILC